MLFCLRLPSKHGCRQPYCTVTSDIDRAITKYTFFGDGDANLHTNFFETREDTLKIVLLSSLTLKTWV